MSKYCKSIAKAILKEEICANITFVFFFIFLGALVSVGRAGDLRLLEFVGDLE